MCWCFIHYYIPYSTFTITKVQLHVSAISVGHLQVVHEALNNKLYLHVSGEFTVCGVRWVRDLVLCLQKGYGSGLFRGFLLNYRSCLLIAMSISRLHFLYVPAYIGNTILSWTTSKLLWFSIYSFLHILDYSFTISASLYHTRWLLCTIIVIYDLLLKA